MRNLNFLKYSLGLLILFFYCIPIQASFFSTSHSKLKQEINKIIDPDNGSMAYKEGEDQILNLLKIIFKNYDELPVIEVKDLCIGAFQNSDDCRIIGSSLWRPPFIKPEELPASIVRIKNDVLTSSKNRAVALAIEKDGKVDILVYVFCDLPYSYWPTPNKKTIVIRAVRAYASGGRSQRSVEPDFGDFVRQSIHDTNKSALILAALARGISPHLVAGNSHTEKTLKNVRLAKIEELKELEDLEL